MGRTGGWLGGWGRRILPLGFAWEPICHSCCSREPGDKLLCIAPAYVRDGRIIFAGCDERTCLRSGAFVPVANGNRILADRKRFYRDLVSWLLCDIVIATHCEAAAANRVHLGFSDRRGRRCGCRGGRVRV